MTPALHAQRPESSGILRVATYNIHKGCRGLGPARRLEIHNLGLAVEQLDADIVCLQEVPPQPAKSSITFDRWPARAQVEYPGPEGYEAVYAPTPTRATVSMATRCSRAGPCLAPARGHSDHRFEQRACRMSK